MKNPGLGKFAATGFARGTPAPNNDVIGLDDAASFVGNYVFNAGDRMVNG